MINKVNKIFKKYGVEFEEGVEKAVRFISSGDFQKIAKLDKSLLAYRDAPSVYDLIHSREDMYAEAFIKIRNDRIDAFLTGVYLPLDLDKERFNRIVGLFAFERHPNYIERIGIKDKEYLFLWWD